MKTENGSRRHKINLDTPRGWELRKKIAESLRIKFEMTENSGVQVELLFDKQEVNELIYKYLIASYESHTIPFDPALLNSIMNTCEANPHDPMPGIRGGLNEKQYQIMELVAKGKEDKEIATMLKMSYHSVRGYIKRILRKLSARNRIEAVMIFLKNQGRLADMSQDTRIALAKLGIVKELN